jgi:hypothetical protein
MKYTLLEMVQDILNDLDSDEVNSIDDTVEAAQVAQIIKTCYNEMMSNRNWPHTRKLFQLEASNDTSKPTYLIIPESLKELVSFQYDKTPKGSTDLIRGDVIYKQPDDFMRILNSRSLSNPNTQAVVDYEGVKLITLNNTPPTYWTSFDDKHLVCDSYDKSVDDTLMRSKTACLAYTIPEWRRDDTAVPDLPVEAFPALLEEAKSTAFLALKQVANSKAEQKSVRQQRWLSRKAWSTHGGISYPNYGRKV